MARDEDLMRFPDITRQIETTYKSETAFLCENLDKAVADCARGAYQNGVKTGLSLKVRFERGKGDAMIIRADLETSIPNPEASPIAAFVDRDGSLVKDDPRQTTLPGVEPFQKRS